MSNKLSKSDKVATNEVDSGDEQDQQNDAVIGRALWASLGVLACVGLLIGAGIWAYVLTRPKPVEVVGAKTSRQNMLGQLLRNELNVVLLPPSRQNGFRHGVSRDLYGRSATVHWHTQLRFCGIAAGEDRDLRS